MNKLHSTKLDLKQQRQSDQLAKNSFSKKSLIIGTVIATFIALTPYFFYLYTNVPSERIWITSWFTFDSGADWNDANYAIWVLIGKLLPLSLILLWFVTCRHWWYHALLVPISMYIYQIIGFFNDNLSYFDDFKLKHLFPFMAVVIPLIYLSRARLFNRINNVEKSTQELEDEIRISPKSVFGFVKQYF